MPTKFMNTPHQREIVGVILNAADKGEILRMSELRERLSYGDKVIYQTVRCSVDLLVKQGILVREHEDGKALVKPTTRAYDLYRGISP